jgi:hypothetical protein
MTTAQFKMIGAFRSPVVIVTALLVLSICVAQTRKAAATKRVELLDGATGLSFVPPPGLAAMSDESIASVFQAEPGKQPKFAFTDKAQQVFVAISHFGDNASEDQLVELKQFLEQHVDKTYANREWLERNWLTINSKRWFRLKFRVVGGTKDVVNDYYVTDWLGQYILFNFSSMAEVYEAHRADLELSARTIRLSMVAEIAPVRTITRKP